MSPEVSFSPAVSREYFASEKIEADSRESFWASARQTRAALARARAAFFTRSEACDSEDLEQVANGLVRYLSEVGEENLGEIVEWLGGAQEKSAPESVSRFDTLELLLLTLEETRRELCKEPVISRRGVALLLTLAVILFASSAVYLVTRPLAPWSTSYFRGPDLRGPVVGTENFEKLKIDWSYLPPLRQFQDGNYSARFEACYVVDESSVTTFELGSDDGSRLFLDGKLLINMWKDQPYETAEAKALIKAGGARLKVEYYQKGGGAKLTLRVKGSGDAAFREIPQEQLAHPKDGNC